MHCEEDESTQRRMTGFNCTILLHAKLLQRIQKGSPLCLPQHGIPFGFSFIILKDKCFQSSWFPLLDAVAYFNIFMNLLIFSRDVLREGTNFEC